MEVLIVERDQLVGSMLADALAGERISVAVARDEEALALPPDADPRVVITGINRGHNEDLIGLQVVSAMRHKWPHLRAIYLAALWPVRLRQQALTASERFLTRPVRLAAIIRTVRELLDSNLCRQPN
jgi:DNA-binding response OmpR family regulator